MEKWLRRLISARRHLPVWTAVAIVSVTLAFDITARLTAGMFATQDAVQPRTPPRVPEPGGVPDECIELPDGLLVCDDRYSERGRTGR